MTSIDRVTVINAALRATLHAAATESRALANELAEAGALESAETTLPATFRVSPLKKLALAPPHEFRRALGALGARVVVVAPPRDEVLRPRQRGGVERVVLGVFWEPDEVPRAVAQRDATALARRFVEAEAH